MGAAEVGCAEVGTAEVRMAEVGAPDGAVPAPDSDAAADGVDPAGAFAA